MFGIYLNFIVAFSTIIWLQSCILGELRVFFVLYDASNQC